MRINWDSSIKIRKDRKFCPFNGRLGNNQRNCSCPRSLVPGWGEEGSGAERNEGGILQ